SRKIRSLQILSIILSTISSVSESSAPRSRRYPWPISPTTLPSTETLAFVTLCSTTFIAFLLLGFRPVPLSAGKQQPQIFQHRLRHLFPVQDFPGVHRVVGNNIVHIQHPQPLQFHPAVDRPGVHRLAFLVHRVQKPPVHKGRADAYGV